MSYSIIFDTKFIKLTDGRLLHLNRSGCNNDTAGRDLWDYIGKIYTVEKFNEHVESFMKGGKADCWELKINNKYCTYYEYGEHLLRMAKRAKTYEQFCSERTIRAKRLDGVRLYKPEEKMLTVKEFDDNFYKYLYSGEPFSYSRVMTDLNGEIEIVNALDDGQPVSIYVCKKFKN